MIHPEVDSMLEKFAQLIDDKSINEDACWQPDSLKVGVDLGTANIVVSVLDENDVPVTGAMCRSTVVRDGIVVDYVGAVTALQGLKAELEQRLGCPLVQAGTAIPPGILPGNIKAIVNVAEAAGFEIIDVSDEPTAAARVLGIETGAVVDIGGGTTGISILKEGKIVSVDDEATGGTHMTLVLAGAYGLSFAEAEEIKLQKKDSPEIFSVLLPVVEKMASIVNRFLIGHDIDAIYVVGGACSFTGFERVFSKSTGIKVFKPAEPLLVTPLGIAMYQQAVQCQVASC